MEGGDVTAWRAIGPEPCLGLTQLGAAPPGRWSVRPTTISAPPWLALWKFFLFLLQLRIFVSTKGILKHCLSSLRKP